MKMAKNVLVKHAMSFMRANDSEGKRFSFYIFYILMVFDMENYFINFSY